MDFGSSYLPSDINAAYLWAQLEMVDEIKSNRLATWEHYRTALHPLAEAGKIQLPYIPEHCQHNAHMFYIKTADLAERSELIKHLRAREIVSAFHYIPLHSAPAGQRFGRFCGEDRYTTKESERLLRLPMYYGLPKESVDKVIDGVISFYE